MRLRDTEERAAGGEKRRIQGRARGVATSALAVAAAAILAQAGASGCSSDTGSSGSPTGSGGTGGGAGSGGGVGGTGGTIGTGGAGGASTGGAGGTGGVVDPGPNVDVSDPQLYKTSFAADDADPEATKALGAQLAFLDTTADPRGLLVVYLHGAGAPPATCGSDSHGTVLAGLGFHVLSPCYLSDYGVANCNDDIEGCRLEAFEGVDHTSVIDVTPPNSAEQRITKGLLYLQQQIPQGDWTYFLDGDKPKWSKIIISGISHGASSSAVIGKHRLVHRVVSLSGPLDSGQAWLKKPSITPIDRFFAFTHTGDNQHQGHLQSFADLGLLGDPISVDGASPPYEGSHRLISSAPTTDGHNSTQAGSKSPKDANGAYLFMPVWTYMYAGDPAP
jgi:hypothetical protein